MMILIGIIGVCICERIPNIQLVFLTTLPVPEKVLSEFWEIL